MYCLAADVDRSKACWRNDNFRFFDDATKSTQKRRFSSARAPSDEEVPLAFA